MYRWFSTIKAAGKMNFTIRRAVPADLDNIFKFLKTNFYPYEPLSMEIGEPEHPNEEWGLSSLHQGMSLLTVSPLPNNRERIVGACINAETTPDTWREMEKFMEKTEIPTTKKLLKLLVTSYKKIDVWNGGKIDKCFAINMFAVDREFRGKNIGVKLANKSTELAKILGYKLVYVESTGIYSAKLAEQINMKCAYTLAYKDYTDKDGQPVFEPPHPHKEFKIFTLSI